MQLIQEGEHTHCATRRNWLNMSSHQLFREESNTTTTANYSNANTNSGNNNTTTAATTTNTSKVRWENDQFTPNTTTPSTPVPTAPSAATDASPVPRRSKSAVDYEYNYNNNANNGNNGNNGNNYTDEYTPPPAGNRPASYSLSQQVNKSNNISPMVSRRLDGGISTDDFADNNNNNLNSEKQRNMRRLAVPALSERLNALSHLTHAMAAPRPKNINNMQNTYNVNSNTNKPGEFLIDRFLRTLSTQPDSGMSVNYANYANNAALTSALAGNNAISSSTSELYSAAIAADTLEAMAQLVSSSRFEMLFLIFAMHLLK